MNELTDYVCDWVLGLTYDSLPIQVRRLALEHVYDGYGLMLSGLREDSYQIIQRYIRQQSTLSGVHMVGTSLYTTPSLAALAAGVAMHALDFDDTQLSTQANSVYGLLTHPTAPVLAAATSVADSIDASGKDLITAYIAGIEVACRLADSMNSRHYMDGFHTTGTVGTFGAVAAAGKLWGLDETQMRFAFGIAPALGGGFRENFGTMSKPLHAGNAAYAGVMAAWLAREGFTASNNILEGPRGFFAAAAGGYDPTRVAGRLGSPYYFEDPGISIKLYPCGSLAHPSIDGVLSMVNENDLSAEDIVELNVFTNSATLNALKYRIPKSGLEGKFSLPFLLSCAVLFRRVGITEFSDKVVQREDVGAFMRRCRHEADEAIDSRGFQHMETHISMKLTNGRTLERTELKAFGHPDKPVSSAQLKAKFSDCTSMILMPEQVNQVSEIIWKLQELDHISALHEMLCPK